MCVSRPIFSHYFYFIADTAPIPSAGLVGERIARRSPRVARRERHDGFFF
jgi:hypothetical protein